MFSKAFAQISVLALFLLALLAAPVGVQAGGVCGGTYIVDAGDTLNSIAARCGTTVSAITTANPGVADPLKAGQTLTLPGVNYTSSGAASSTLVSSDMYNYNTYNTYNYYQASPAPVTNSSGGTYIVQYGDTFSAIASRYGLSINQLWAANPQIWNINYLYVGQLIYIPASSGQYYTTTYPIMVAPATELEPLSYGTVPEGTPYGAVRLVNKSSSKEIYVSLQGVTRDGVSVIYEYPVSGFLKVKVPAGDYTYVAWANGQEFVGYFHLGHDSDRTLTFRNEESAAE